MQLGRIRMRNIAIFLHSSSPDSDSVPSISITFMRNCISYLNPPISISNKRNYDDLMRRIRCLCGNRTQDLVQEPKPNFIGREIAPSLRIILCYISEELPLSPKIIETTSLCKRHIWHSHKVNFVSIVFQTNKAISVESNRSLQYLKKAEFCGGRNEKSHLAPVYRLRNQIL